MLGAFAKNVAEAPKELSSPSWSADITPTDRQSGGDGAGPDELLCSFPGSVKVGVSGIGGIAFTPGAAKAMAVMEGVVCVIEGQIENLSSLRREYGLPPNCSQESLLIHAFVTLRDRGPFPPDRVVRDLSGRFAFVLFDTKNRIVFAARDRHGSAGVGLLWGTARNGSTVFSDNVDFLRSACGKSFAPFPSGCYFSTNMGIKSYEFPSAKLTAMPTLDSKGDVTGATFAVDYAKKDMDVSASMRRVGSEANWAQTI